jgi:predicted AlkP superfamily phosphohydrolase/phosphomutase
MTDAPARLVLIGLDAASPVLLTRWARDGTMPNLGAMIDRGVSGATRGIDGFYVGSTWPSLYTGLNPARHGVHYLVQIVPGTYDLRWKAGAGLADGPPFWRVLSDAGRRVAVLDVPLTRLEPKLNGVQTVEWGGHDSLDHFRSSPPELGTQLLARHGGHPVVGACDADRRSGQDYADFVDALVRGCSTKATWTREVLAEGNWDLLIQVFSETHCVGHQCWHLHDKTHPAFDPSLSAELGDPMRTVYQRVDRAIGEVLRDVEDARVVVFSSHGMSHRFGAQFLLGDILVRLGVTVPRHVADAQPPAALRVARHAAETAWRVLPGALRRPLAGMRSRTRAHSSVRPVPAIPADAPQSLCFPQNNGLAVGGIRLNLMGREPCGRLQPGTDARQFCDRLEHDLLEIRDHRTGGPLVAHVLRTADHFQGSHLDELPDLLVEWNDELATGSTAIGRGMGAVVRASSPKIGMLEGRNEYGRSGEHRPDGWFVATGPGIRPGQVRPVSVLDLAPTFARMLGVDMSECDGSVIPALCDASRT